jgi:phenylpyruvate tautomerase PptA (4-oxalocrotonate tautomerase family)
MPLYRCTVSPGSTSYQQRAWIAKEVTRIHVEVTGGLPGLVHTFFAEDATGALPAGKRAFVLGGIRAGRTTEQKQRLVSEMTGSIASALGVSTEEVTVVTVDVPARWVMEGGDVLPEPGEEAEWLARHAEGADAPR